MWQAAIYLSGRASMAEFIKAVCHAVERDQKGVLSRSMCEHHLIKFYGVCKATGSVPATCQLPTEEQVPVLGRLTHTLCEHSVLLDKAREMS